MYNVTYLRDIQVGLHDQKRIQCVRTRGIRVVKKIFDFSECCLTKARTAIFVWDVSRLVGRF